MRANIDSSLLLKHAEQELAQRSLLDFGRRVYPGFEAPPHLEHIAGLLERVESGEIKRLMVNLPMRHGKSVLCSQIFPAWLAGRHPTENTIIATHSAELSEKNSRAARAIVESEPWPFDAKMSADSTAVHRWNLTEGGGVFAVGVEGKVTGRGGNKIIVDDPLDREGTELERLSATRWFSEVLYPRLEPGGAIVLLGTRFAESDVFGSVQDGETGKQWHVVRLPGLAEQGDPLGRNTGAALWPARFDEAALLDQRAAMGERAWQSQVQQNPLPATGNLIDAAWLSHRYSEVPSGLRITVSLDAAAKTGLSNDFSVAVVLGSDKAKHYVLDVWRKKVDFPGLQRMLLAIGQKWSPSHYYIEDASSGTQLIQSLKAETSLPITAVSPKGSKLSRVEACTGLLEAGTVLLPADSNAPAWLSEFMRELLGFPGSRHDDQCDALALGLAQVAKRRFFYVGSVDDWLGDSDGDRFSEQSDPYKLVYDITDITPTNVESP